MLKKTFLLVALLLAISIEGRAQIEPFFLNATQEQIAKRVAWVDSVYNSMTLEEQIGQMFIYTVAPQNNKPNIDLLKRVIKDYKIGGLLFSGGEIAEQVKLTNLAQDESKLPLMITFDGEWGLSMRLKNTPKFPRNMVLGCITDESLLYAYGKEMGRQCLEMGVHVNFAPVADVNVNPNNPVINTRSFGELPENVSEKVIAYSKGLESQNVLAVSKHFPGHGDTNVDSHKSLPVLKFDRARLDSIELVPFKDYINAQLGGVMVGHLHIPALDKTANLPSSLSKPIITDLLKNELGFNGLVFTDALEMRGVSAHNDRCLKAIQAGNDLLLTPRKMKEEMNAILKAVKSGDLPKTVIEERCKKILAYKYEMGLTKKPFIKLSGLTQSINSKEAEVLISNLEVAAITLFKNDNQVLPLKDSFKKIACIYTDNENDYAELFNGLSDNYEVGKIKLPAELTAVNRTKIEEQIKNYDRVLICLDQGNLERYNTFFSVLKTDRPLGYIFYMGGEKLHLMEKSLRKAEIALLAHTNKANVQKAVVDILYGRRKSTGRLAVSVGESYKAGTDWRHDVKNEKATIAKDLGLSVAMLNHIDSIADEAIEKKAFPGCQVTVLKNGLTVYEKAFGTFTGPGSKEVSTSDFYDLASLSKTTGTLLAVMKLYDKGLINLTDYVSKYLPALVGTDKAKITIEELLLHESGMGAGLSIYNHVIDKDSYVGPLFKGNRDSKHIVQLGRRSWANPKYRFKKGLTSSVQDDTHKIQVATDIWFNESVSDSVVSTIIENRLLAKRYRYSCLGFILLKQVVEHVSRKPMDVFLADEFFTPMGLDEICYTPLKYFDVARIVPSADDQFFRKEVLQGFVHDELAALQGGVSGNAGQFGTARAVATIYQLFLDKGFYQGKRYLSESTCTLFTTKKSKISRRGLGFDKPNADANQSSACLKTVPIETFGHTGFTGSCAWADPKNNLVFVLTCNRTYPKQYPNKLAEYDIRNRMQQAIYDSLD